MSPIELYNRAKSGSLSADEVSRLIALAEAYPYFALPYLIQARQSAKGNGANAQVSLAKAAVYAHDRRKLAASLEEQYAAPTSDAERTSAPAVPSSPLSTAEEKTAPKPDAPVRLEAEPFTPPPAPEVKSAAPAPEAPPAVRYVPKESIPKAAPSTPLPTVKLPERTPEPIPSVPVKAAEIGASLSPDASVGPVRGIDQKLQTVLNVRVGMYVPLAAQLAKEAKSFQSEHAAALVPNAEAPSPPQITAEEAPISSPETTPEVIAESASIPVAIEATKEVAPSPPPAATIEPTPAQPEATQLVRTVISKNAPVAPRAVERKIERVVERRSATEAASAIPLPPKVEHSQTSSSDRSALESKIAAMIAEKAVSIDSKMAAPTPLAPARGPGVTIPAQLAPHPNRPAGAHPALSGALPLAVKAVPPPVVAKAAPKETAGPPEQAAPAAPAPRSIAATPEPTEAKSQPERERNRPDPQEKLKAPWERRAGPRDEEAPATGTRQPTPLLDQPMDSGMDQLRRSLLSMIQTQINEAYDPAAPTQSAPPPPQNQPVAKAADAPSPPQPLSASVEQASAAPVVETQVATPPVAASPAVQPSLPSTEPEKATGTSLRGSSESMRRFVSPEFEGGVRTIMPEVGAQAEAPKSAPVPTSAKAPLSETVAVNPDLHSSIESMRRFVQPDFTSEPSRSAVREETTSADSPSTVVPDATSPAPLAPIANDDIKGGNSMLRFAQPDFSLKPSTLHLDRPERDGIKTPPLAPPRQEQAGTGAIEGAQSDSFKRFVAPTFDAATTQQPAASAPSPEPAPAEAPVVAESSLGDSSASFKRFVSPDFSTSPTVPAPAALEVPAPDSGVEIASTSPSMKRFAAPDFGAETLVERMEQVHGQDLVIPEASREPSIPSDALRQAANQLSNDKLEESFMRGGLTEVAREFEAPRPIAPPQSQSVAETLAAIQLKDNSGSESLGQVLADVSDQSSIATTGSSDITERIESFRQNLAKLRQRSMPNPSEINLRTIQQKFLDRIVQATGRAEGGTPPGPSSTEPPKNDDSEGERAPAGPENSVVTLVGRFKAFEPRLAESLSAIRQNPTAFAKNSPTEADLEADDTGDAVASETLARILWQQGQADKARRMVEQLALNQPEKSAYFAALLANWV